MLSKDDMMKLTGNDTGVDGALPEDWLHKVCELGFDRDDILGTYGYSYKGNPYGKPLNLPVEFLRFLDKTEIDCVDQRGEPIKTYKGKPTLLEFVMSILNSSDKWAIRLK